MLVVEFLSVCPFQAKNLIFPQKIETKSSFMTISLQFLSYHNPCSDKVCTLLIISQEISDIKRYKSRSVRISKKGVIKLIRMLIYCCKIG